VLVVNGVTDENYLFDAVGELLRGMEVDGRIELMGDDGDDPGRGDWYWDQGGGDDEG